HTSLAAQRLVFLAAERQPRIAARACRPHYLEQLARVLHRIDAKEEQAVPREHRSNQPKADGDRADDGDSREGGAAEGAERVEDGAGQAIDETGATRVAALVGSQQYRAEARQREVSCLARAQTVGDLPLRFAFDMERELVVQLAFDVPGSHQRASAEE